MSHGGDHRHAAVKDRLRHRLIVKGPQVLNGTAAASHDHHIHANPLQRADSVHNAGHRLIALHDGRIQDDLHIGISPVRDIDDILHRCPGRCCHHPQGSNIFGNRLFVLGREQAPLLKLLFQPLKFLI